MQQPSRALRRHHRARLKKQWQRRRAGPGGALPAGRLIGRQIRTPAACSCPLCGNPRRFFGEATLQERRATQPGTMAAAGIAPAPATAPQSQPPSSSSRAASANDGCSV